MENFTQLIAQLDSAKLNIAEVSRKLKEQVFELEAASNKYDFMLSDAGSDKDNKQNRLLRNELVLYYRRMVSHELGLVQEDEELRFENVCRNAQMQMEGLLDYFFRCNSLATVQQFVSEYNSYVDEVNEKIGKQSHKHISKEVWWKVTFADKYFLFQKVTLDIELTNFLKILAKYRNSISHVGYGMATTDNEIKAFATNKKINSVLSALEQLRIYVENNRWVISNKTVEAALVPEKSSTSDVDASKASENEEDLGDIQIVKERSFKETLVIPDGKHYGLAGSVFIEPRMIRVNGWKNGQVIEGKAIPSTDKGGWRAVD